MRRLGSPQRSLYRRSASPVPRESVSRALVDTTGRVPRPFQLAGALPAERAVQLQQAWANVAESERRSREDLQQMQEFIEAQKKEMQQLSGVQSRVQWDARREERNQQSLDWKASEDEHREWAAEQVAGMRCLTEETMHEEKQRKLTDAREFQRFQSEKRTEARALDKDALLHQFRTYQDHAELQKDIAAASQERERQLVVERRAAAVRDRVSEAEGVLRERCEEQDAGFRERKLELARALQELTAQKEQLLCSIDYTRRRCAESPVSDRARELTSAQAQRCVSHPRFSKN